MRRILRAVRLDASDEHTYPLAARPGEWVAVGSFFWTLSEEEPKQLQGAERQAFRNGFLGIETFGWTTLCAVEEIEDDMFTRVTCRLAEQMVAHFGAPSVDEALPYAREEMEATEAVASRPLGALIAVVREFRNDEIEEQFRVVRDQAQWQGEGVQVFKPIIDEGGEGS